MRAMAEVMDILTAAALAVIPFGITKEAAADMRRLDRRYLLVSRSLRGGLRRFRVDRRTSA
jgi:hypothetical protein